MEFVLKNINALLGGLFLPAVLFASGLYFLFRIGRYVFSPRFIIRSLFDTGEKNERDNPGQETKCKNNGKSKSGEKKRSAVLETGEKNEKIKRGVLSQNDKKKDTRSPFSSLCLALAGTLGVGNISGVAAAITVGGPGAVFWIWVSAIVSAVLKFAETVLALCYRERDADGNFCGGAHLYIKKGLNAPAMAVFFCITCILTSFTMGSITQTKAAADGVFTALNISPLACGAVFFVAILYLSIRGSEKISAFTLKLIPPLCLAYVILSLTVIFIFRDNVLYVTSVIFSEAFTPRAGVGGLLGFLSSPAMRYGVTRGIMSNEAGCGTAPFAHARAETDSPVRQGVYGIIEVLCDTLILCTLTAYVVLLSGAPFSGGATELAINSFASALGEPVKAFLGISIFLFALGSVVGWSFYGQESVKALGFGKRALKIYGVLFSLSAALGCIIPENVVWELADFSISVMAVINIIAVLLLSEAVIRLTREYCVKKRKYSDTDGAR